MSKMLMDDGIWKELLLYGNVFYQQTLEGTRRITREEWLELSQALVQMTEQQDEDLISRHRDQPSP